MVAAHRPSLADDTDPLLIAGLGTNDQVTASDPFEGDGHDDHAVPVPDRDTGDVEPGTKGVAAVVQPLFLAPV